MRSPAKSRTPQGSAQCLRVSPGQLGRAMKLRVIPQLRFHFDTLQGQSRHIDSLIDQAVGKKPAVRQDDDNDQES